MGGARDGKREARSSSLDIILSREGIVPARIGTFCFDITV
jgi:hypothetical protein